MQDAIIIYQIELLRGPDQGRIVEITANLSDLEEQTISDLLVEEGFLEEADCFPDEVYNIIDRSVHVLEEGASFS